MNLNFLENDVPNAKLASRITLLFEGYGRTYDANYENWHTDPRPLILVIGYYVNPNTQNRLMCGININNLNSDQIIELRKALPKIIGTSKSTKARYWKGRELVPEIFEKSYRTYNTDYVNIISPGTLRFYNPKADARLEKARLLKIERERQQKLADKHEKELAKKTKASEPEYPEDIPYQPEKVEKQKDINPKAIQSKVNKLLNAKPKSKPEPKEIPYEPEKKRRKPLNKKRRPTSISDLVQDVEPKKKLKRQRRIRRDDNAYESYINDHDAIMDIDIGDKNAVFDLVTNRLISDDVDHEFILENAGWHSDYVILYKVNNGEIISEHKYNGIRDIEELDQINKSLLKTLCVKG